MATKRKTAPAAPTESEPRWPVALAILAAGALPFALPRSLSILPPWISAVMVGMLVVAAVVTHYIHAPRWNQLVGYAILALLTIALLYSLGTLIDALPRHLETAKRLLDSAAIIWVTNVLVFAVWYWRLDAGGPNERDSRVAHIRGAFLFPQMAITVPDTDGKSMAEVEQWRPQFVDYLALSFYTCTAFSPTDTLVLSRWAKLMMMVQAVMSFTTVALLAARGVNIL